MGGAWAPRRRTGAAESTKNECSAPQARSRANPAATPLSCSTTAAATRAATARSNTGGPAAQAPHGHRVSRLYMLHLLLPLISTDTSHICISSQCFVSKMSCCDHYIHRSVADIKYKRFVM